MEYRSVLEKDPADDRYQVTDGDGGVRVVAEDEDSIDIQIDNPIYEDEQGEVILDEEDELLVEVTEAVEAEEVTPDEGALIAGVEEAVAALEDAAEDGGISKKEVDEVIEKIEEIKPVTKKTSKKKG